MLLVLDFIIFEDANKSLLTKEDAIFNLFRSIEYFKELSLGLVSITVTLRLKLLYSKT